MIQPIQRGREGERGRREGGGVGGNGFRTFGGKNTAVNTHIAFLLRFPSVVFLKLF
jgi:hypothetical protein